MLSQCRSRLDITRAIVLRLVVAETSEDIGQWTQFTNFQQTLTIFDKLFVNTKVAAAHRNGIVQTSESYTMADVV